MAERAVNLPSRGADPVPPGGGGSNVLEQRVAHLEADVGEMKSDLKAIRSDLTRIIADMAYLKGRVEMVPTSIQLVGFAVAVFVAAGVLQLFQ